jgi:arylsulfatase A-like enzyme
MRHQDAISRRQFLRAAGIGVAAMALPTGLFAADGRKPNVIVILSDDHGYASIGCQGGTEIPTPNIDSIAKNGIRCTNGYVTCAFCSPTRAGLMTGRYQQRFGHEDNPGPPAAASPIFGLPEGEKTIADYMKAEGYATGMVGKWHLGHRPECHPQKRGFDEFFGFLTGAHSYTNPGVGTLEPILRGTTEVDEKEYLTDAFGREALSFIDKHKEKPFFLYLAFNAVHHPLETPERYKDSFSQFKIPEKRKYATMLTAMDDAVGKVLAKVRESGLEEDTLIFFLGDNGGYRLAGFAPNIPLNGFKGDAFEGGIRIPYLVQWKGRIPAGKVYEEPVVSLDILPTAVTLAGGKPGSNIEGVNLLPFLAGEKSAAPHDRLFWRMIDRSGARVGDWKLVRNGDGTEKLFNLADDIRETKDLAATNPEKLKEVQAAYKEWDAKNIPPKWLDHRRKPKTE